MLELLPGICTWLVLTSLIWASLLAPLALAIVALVYDTYWLYRSTSLGIRLVVAYRRLRRSEAFDWLAAASQLSDFERVCHLLIVPTYGEHSDILRATLRHVSEQDFPRERLAVVLAFEARDSDAPERARILLQEFQGQFGFLWATFHPELPGEVACEHHDADDLEAGRLAEVLPDHQPTATPISVLYPRSRQLSPRVRVFVDWLVKILGPTLDPV